MHTGHFIMNHFSTQIILYSINKKKYFIKTKFHILHDGLLKKTFNFH